MINKKNILLITSKVQLILFINLYLNQYLQDYLNLNKNNKIIIYLRKILNYVNFIKEAQQSLYEYKLNKLDSFKYNIYLEKHFLKSKSFLKNPRQMHYF